MLGKRLVTKQTGPEGKVVSKVLIAERKYIRRELYLSIVLDRKACGPVLLASTKGGTDIETLAHDNPQAIIRVCLSRAERADRAEPSNSTMMLMAREGRWWLRLSHSRCTGADRYQCRPSARASEPNRREAWLLEPSNGSRMCTSSSMCMEQSLTVSRGALRPPMCV